LGRQRRVPGRAESSPGDAGRQRGQNGTPPRPAHCSAPRGTTPRWPWNP